MHTQLSHIELNFEGGPDEAKRGPVTVGWLLNETKSAVIFEPPERLSTGTPGKSHAKSASRCPAIYNMEARYFVIKCPFDIHVGFKRGSKGEPLLINRAGQNSTIRRKKLAEKLLLTPETEWRSKDRPIVQLMLPYLFVADEPVFVTQVSTFAHFRKTQLPGTIFGGRFPIHIWPRQLMWAFEWHNPDTDITLKRGEPLFYCQFEGTAPDRPIQMVEAVMTSELKTYIEQISGAVNYVNQTFSLFKAAERIRPKKLVTKLIQ